MNEYGRVAWKLAVINDVFELQELGNLLRETTEFRYSDQALSNYLKKRQPPPGFSDQLRRALGRSQEMYNLLLYVQDKAGGKLTPVQREQTERFEQMLRDDVARRFLSNGGGATN